VKERRGVLGAFGERERVLISVFRVARICHLALARDEGGIFPRGKACFSETAGSRPATWECHVELTRAEACQPRGKIPRAEGVIFGSRLDGWEEIILLLSFVFPEGEKGDNTSKI
jgi:hypothetical protein